MQIAGFLVRAARRVPVVQGIDVMARALLSSLSRLHLGALPC